MIFEELRIKGLYKIQPKVFGDSRGYFYESFNKQTFDKNIPGFNFVQDNQALSSKGVLRGLHYQTPPFEQGKLVRVTSGAAIDVVVDIRKNSATFGEHVKVELTEDNKTMFWVPPGFAHGYVTLEDNTIFQYKVSNLYSFESERCLLWNDPKLNIDWGVENPTISEKDAVGKSLSDLDFLF